MLSNAWSVYTLERVLVLVLTYRTTTQVAGLNICTHMATLRVDMPTGQGATPTKEDATMKKDVTKSTDLTDSRLSNVSDSDLGFSGCLDTCRRHNYCTSVSFDRRARLCYLHFGNGRIYEGIGRLVPSIVFGYVHNQHKALEQPKTNIDGIELQSQLPDETDTAKYQPSSKWLEIADRRTTVDTEGHNHRVIATAGPVNQLKQGTDEIIESPCSSDAGCARVNGSVCTSQRCQCPHPLEYSDKQKACVLCTSFEQIPGHIILKNNDHIVGLDTVEECERLCMNEGRFICNSFDYCQNKNNYLYRILTGNKPACLLSMLSLPEAKSKKVFAAAYDCVLGYRVCQ